MEIQQSAVNILRFLVINMMIVVKAKLAMEKNANPLVATIKIACQMKDVSEVHVEQFAALITSAVRTLSVKIEFVKRAVEQTTTAHENNHVSTSNVLTLVRSQVNVVLARLAMFSTMQFNAVVPLE